MILHGLGDEVSPLETFNFAEGAVPWPSIEDPSSQLYGSVTWSVGSPVEGILTSGSTWTVSIYSSIDVLFEKTDTDAVTRYVYANGLRIARINPDATFHYFLSDHLGSTRKVLDANRVEQYSVEYEPFGKPYSTSGPKPDSHKYTMEKHDDPTGLVYLRARQYDPEIGRFVSADPVLGIEEGPTSGQR